MRFVDINSPSTWTNFREDLCSQCTAKCCQMSCDVTLEDLVRLELVDSFEAEVEKPKNIAKRLKKEGYIEHFNIRNTIFTLQRMANRDCIFLDSKTRKCTVYDKRPSSCKTYPEQYSQRKNFCPYERKR
ncbi:YkgJ family cysteine cluster protein [Halobacteriovorax sp.]|uniref:YkgJ family cysteine cluster protein n=1 Tax=Halobacteriovorax sp. TaxID=2020862 RepID=UPI0035612BA9